MSDAIRAAVSRLKTQAALARALDVTPVTVAQWVSGVRKIPEDRCPFVERLCSGEVSAEQLRPDVPWLRIPDPFWPHPAGRPVIDVAGEHQPGDGAVSAGPQMSDRAQAVT